ncbi:MAG TPA: IS4 family transposase [Acidimicrobiales bacterium]|nr:IS4 family transposase [Acidimicrobiales bacterium]
MSRAGWKKLPSGRRLSDVVSVGLLTRVFPPDVVDEVIAESGRREQRHRWLPARVMTYFSVGMALHADGSYEDVLGLLTDGLAWADPDPDAEPLSLPSKSAIFQARDRLGAEPVAALFNRVARPLATPATPGAWLAGRRLVAIDGTCLDVADTAVNDEHFGRPGVNKGERSAFPQARVVALAECATHAIFDAVVGPYTSPENTLARELVGRLEPGMLVLADRGFCGFPLWSRAAATGADLLWRAMPNMKPRHIETLADGTWLAELHPANNSPDRHADAVTIRVIDYQIDDGRTNDQTYRLFTTLLDPEVAPATDLALAYAPRWEIESAFDELKTHQRGPRTVLRSKSPDLVLQEIWGHLCCHFAIRTLMWEAADHAGIDADRVSFVAALRIARRSITAARDFPPSTR